MRIRLISLAITLLAALALAPAAWAAPTTFTVDNIGAGADAAPGDGDCATSGFVCTLRAAIEESNATGGGAPYTINFNVSQISVTSGGLPAITRSGTFVDGCGVGRTDPPFNAPKDPVNGNCSGLIGTGAAVGLQVGDASSDPTGVAIYNLAFTNFTSAAVRIWGADRTRVGGNLMGRRINGTNEGNGTAVRIAGRTQNGTLVNSAIGNVVGGTSNATDTDAPDCDVYCNTIVNSTQQGIDLVGVAAASGPGDAPAGGDAGLEEGTTINGNWIGVHDAAGTAGSGNQTAVKIGNSLNTTFGTSPFSGGNVIAGNGSGVDQGSGTTSVTVLGGVFGLSPDRNTSVDNGLWNARLGGSDTFGGGAFVQGATFGPSDIGLELTGPRANVVSSYFDAPDSARFTTAAIRVAPGGDGATIGTDDAAPGLPVCVPLIDTCNVIGDTASDAPGIWIDGADNTRIQRNLIGATYAPPVAGPPIRIDGGATGSVIGDDDIGPDARNSLTRLTGPAVEVGEGATKIVIGDNDGLSQNAFDLPTGLFTDLLPDPGPGNSGLVNNGIQPPVVTVSSTTGVGGTGIPGAIIRVLIQQRPPVLGDPDPNVEGTTFPSTPSTTTVGDDGIWGIAFPNPLKTGIKLLASQTTADGSSEYASPLGASESNPPPLITFQSGPSGVVESRSATFTFSSNKPGTRLTCSVDGGAFVPCSSPFTLNGLDIGGHQLQVKGTDPTGKVGPPASRTWIVQFPEPVAASGATRKAPAKIRVLRAGVRKGALDMLIEITSRAATAGAKLSVSYRSSGRTSRFTVPIAKSASSARSGARARTAETRISVRRKLPVAQRKKNTGIVELKYAGNAVVRSDSVRLRAAAGKSRLRRKVTTLKAGRLTVSGTVTGTARGVVRIRLGYDKSDASAAFLYWNAKISKGEWNLSKLLPSAAANGGQLSIQFTGYEPRRLRGEQTAKQILD